MTRSNRPLGRTWRACNKNSIWLASKSCLINVTYALVLRVIVLNNNTKILLVSFVHHIELQNFLNAPRISAFTFFHWVCKFSSDCCPVCFVFIYCFSFVHFTAVLCSGHIDWCLCTVRWLATDTLMCIVVAGWRLTYVKKFASLCMWQISSIICSSQRAVMICGCKRYHVPERKLRLLVATL